MCETCGAVRKLINSMFTSGRWNKTGSTHSGTCGSVGCQEPVALDTQLCSEHALELVDSSAIFTSVRQAVEKTLNRTSTAAIRTLNEALKFLCDPQRGYDGMTVEETEFLCDLKDQKEVYFTDTESIGDLLLLQFSVIDSKGRPVSGGKEGRGKLEGTCVLGTYLPR